MPSRRPVLLISLLFISLVAISGTRLVASSGTSELVAEALSGTPEVRHSALLALRAMGPRGMEALLPELAKVTSEPEKKNVGQVLDKVCGMRDCAVSQLFWYTDFEHALRAAQQSQKPILSLRLLGYLDEELSCANSRFFRTALYPDSEVGRLLRQEFVLHWQSVRPVPRVVVDFGDGRKLQGTLTGNSVHYVLDSQGRLIDALPGLYDPKTFLSEIRAAGEEARQVASLSGPSLHSRIRRHHQGNLLALDSDLRTKLGLMGREDRFESLKRELDQLPYRRFGDRQLTAADAAPRALSKAVVEAPVLSRISRFLAAVEPMPGDDLWPRLAEMRRGTVQLDERSRALLRAHHGLSDVFQTEAAVETFEESLALDTVRNQQLLRRTVHVWLRDAMVHPALEEFNERVYSQLFLTPLSDPWLGMAPRELYSGLAGPITSTGRVEDGVSRQDLDLR